MIVELKTTKDLKLFYEFNINHYQSEKNFVHPLLLSIKDTFNLEKNPFWNTVHHHFLIYIKDNKILGRIAVFVNKTNPEIAHFGFFECINDAEVAQKLFSEAEKLAKSYGARQISGPYNPSLNYELGVLVKGFQNVPFFMMSYNFSYYDRLILSLGYQKHEDFFSFLLAPENFKEHQKLMSVRQKLLKNSKLKLRNINLKNFKNESNFIFDIYNDAFKDHFGFVAFERDEFQYMAKDMSQIINPNFFKIIFWENEPAAFILAIPNLNETLLHLRKGKLFPFGIFKFLYHQPKIKKMRIINVAVKSKFKNLGLGSVLYHSIFEEMKTHHKTIGQLSWIAEDNATMLKIVGDLGAHKENTYRVYHKDLV